MFQLTVGFQCYIAGDSYYEQTSDLSQIGPRRTAGCPSSFWCSTAFPFAASNIGVGFDVPAWHFVLSACWFAALFAFAIAFVFALRWFRKRAGRQPRA